MTLKIDKEEPMKPNELSDEQLEGIVGGGKSEGPICPVCHSINVVFDRQLAKVLYCNNCGYSA